MSDSLRLLLDHLLLLSERIGDSLSRVTYTPPESSNVNIKSTVESLLPNRGSPSLSEISEVEVCAKISDFTLCCAALAAASESTYGELLWIPDSLSEAAVSAFKQLSEAYSTFLRPKNCMKVGELEFELKFMSSDVRLQVELMPQVLPLLKNKIKESAIDKSIDTDEFFAASARTPVAYAILAAHQLKWIVTQVNYPFLGKLCSLVIPCGLTALDHWSQQGQDMISFIHLSKNANASEIGWYEDVILDACCQNIVCSDDEIWQYVVEMSVLMLTSTQKSNPRSIWYEKLLNEMLSHLERQPKNKERRIAWLTHVDSLFDGAGLVLLSHFRRLFPLFFQLMHADDDDTVLLVLERTKTVLRLTWIRNSPYIDRLVDELVSLYKEAAMRSLHDDIRSLILETLILLQQSAAIDLEREMNREVDAIVGEYDSHIFFPGRLEPLVSQFFGFSVHEVQRVGCMSSFAADKALLMALMLAFLSIGCALGITVTTSARIWVSELFLNMAAEANARLVAGCYVEKLGLVA